MLKLTQEQANAIDTISERRTDGGLLVAFDGKHFVCSDERDNPVFEEYWPILTEAAILIPDVNARAARRALYAAGLLDAINSWVATQSKEVQIDWEYATVIERDHPAIKAAEASGIMSAEQIDQLFLSADQL